MRADVLISGAGLAGLQCARILARRGASVLLIDRKPSLRTAVHTTGIFVRKTLEDFGFAEAHLGAPVRRVVLHSPAGRSLELRSEHDEFRVGRMAAIYESMLREARAAGAIFWAGASYEGSRPAGPVSRVRVRCGRLEREIEAKFLIGADGARSAVAADLGLERNRRFLIGLEDAGRGAAAGEEPTFHCLIDPVLAPGYLAWALDDGEEAHIGTAGKIGWFEPKHAIVTVREKMASFVRFSEREVVSRRGGLIPVGGILRRIGSGRGLLVGDAAGAVSPLTAGGLDAAMRLSAAASEVVLRALAREGSDAMASYSGNAVRARFASRLMMRRVLEATRAGWAVELAFALLSTPPGRALAHHVFFNRNGSFPDVAPGREVRVVSP